MECSNQLGFASWIGTFHLSPHENILTIALINIHYLYTIDNMALQLCNKLFQRMVKQRCNTDIVIKYEQHCLQPCSRLSVFNNREQVVRFYSCMIELATALTKLVGF